MEKITTSISQMIDSEQLRGAVPEYLWFCIAIVGILALLYIINRMVNYLIQAVRELKESDKNQDKSIAVIQETLAGIKQILIDYGSDIKELRSKRRGQ